LDIAGLLTVTPKVHKHIPTHETKINYLNITAVPVSQQDAKTIANVSMEEILHKFGVPQNSLHIFLVNYTLMCASL
jgi:hypothetical protein